MAEVAPTYQIFTHFTLFPYLQDHLLYKNQAAKFPAILDSFLFGVDCIRQVPTWVSRGRQDGGFKF